MLDKTRNAVVRFLIGEELYGLVRRIKSGDYSTLKNYVFDPITIGVIAASTIAAGSVGTSMYQAKEAKKDAKNQAEDVRQQQEKARQEVQVAGQTAEAQAQGAVTAKRRRVAASKTTFVDPLGNQMAANVSRKTLLGA